MTASLHLAVPSDKEEHHRDLTLYKRLRTNGQIYCKSSIPSSLSIVFFASMENFR